MKKSVCGYTCLFVLFALLLGFMSLGGCTSVSGPKTYGKIWVDHPEVFTRERLVSSRHNETQWLENKLEDGFKPTTQGYRDIRQFAGTIAKLKAAFDPLGGELVEAEEKKKIEDKSRERQLAEWTHEEERLAHEKKVLELKKEIEGLKKLESETGDSNSKKPAPKEPQENGNEVADGGESAESSENEAGEADSGDDTANESASSETGGNAENKDGNGPVSASELASQVTALKESLDKFSIENTSPVHSGAKLSSIEKLRDEKAYRDMVNAMIRETELDDTHDLRGFSIYTMKFDTTLVPGDNSQTFGQVKLELKDLILDGENKNVNDDILKSLYKSWLKRLQEEFDQEMINLIYRFKWGLHTDQEYVAFRRLAVRLANTLGKDAREEKLKKSLEKLLFFPPALTPRLDFKDIDITVFCEMIKNKYQEPLMGFAILGDPYSIDLTKISEDPSVEKICLCDVGAYNEEGYENFKEKLGTLTATNEKAGYVSSVEPKEYAQNISEVAAREELKNFIFSLDLVLNQFKGLNASGYYEKLDRSQTFLHGITRNPLAVGFANGKNEFGWVLGPKFQIVDEKRGVFKNKTKVGVNYSHTAAQHSFQASVVVPAWWPYLKLKSTTNWLDNQGKDIDSTKEESGDMYVRLPVDYSALTTALVGDMELRRPLIFPELGDNGKARRYLVTESKKGQDSVTHLVVYGRDLWRNPEVFIGNQKADKVSILPDMGGLLVEFNSVKMPPRRKGDRSNPVVDLKVFTSNGVAVMKDGVEILKGDAGGTAQVTVQTSKMIKNSDSFKLAVTPTEAVYGYNNARLLIRPKGLFGVDWKVSGELASHEIEKNKKTLYKFKGVKWEGWKAANGEDISNKKNHIMEALMEIQYQPGGLFQKLGEKDSAGRFSYFKGDTDAKAQWHNKTVNYFVKSGDAGTVKLLSDITLKLSDKELFYIAYPGLGDSLKKKFNLILGKGAKKISVEVAGAVQKSGSGQAALFKIPSGLIVPKLKDILKDGKKHSFACELAYTADKKLGIGGTLTFQKLDIKPEKAEIRYEGQEAKVKLVSDLTIKLENAVDDIQKQLKDGFKIKLSASGKTYSVKLDKNKFSVTSPLTITVKLANATLAGKDNDFIPGLFDLLKDGNSIELDLYIEVNTETCVSGPKITFKKK